MSIFSSFCLDLLISWHCDVDHEADLLLIIDQHNVELILKQMLVSLNGKVSEDLDMISPDYLFMYDSTNQSLLC